MNNTFLAVAGLSLLALYATRANARALPSLPPAFDFELNEDEDEAPVTNGFPEEWDYFDWSLINWLETGNEIVSNYPAKNLAGFLYMLRLCEHLRRDVESGEDYAIFFGGSRFENFADHPVNTGEKRGIRLRPEWCRAAGFKSGVCVSTAAGAYQFTRPTWDGLRRAGRHGPRLPDFSPASQDEAARRLLAEIGALPAVLEGNLTLAVPIAARRWASLPGSTSGQPQKSWQYAKAAFSDGVLRA